MCVHNLGNYQTEQVRYLLLNQVLIVTFSILWHNQSITTEETYTPCSLSHSILVSLNTLPGLVAVGGYHSGTLPVNICHNGWNDECKCRLPIICWGLATRLWQYHHDHTHTIIMMTMYKLLIFCFVIISWQSHYHHDAQAAYRLLRSGYQIHCPASYQICLMVSCLGWWQWRVDQMIITFFVSARGQVSLFRYLTW